MVTRKLARLPCETVKPTMPCLDPQRVWGSVSRASSYFRFPRLRRALARCFLPGGPSGEPAGVLLSPFFFAFATRTILGRVRPV